MKFLPILCLSFLFVAGCSGSKKDGTGIPPKADALNEVAGLISSYSGEFKQGPSKVSDLTRYENGYPIGYQALKNGDVVVVWGVKLIIEEGGGSASTSTDVVAYEKNVPTEGGNVLMLNGKVKTMTADEFKNAPKAKK